MLHLFEKVSSYSPKLLLIPFPLHSSS